jgi:hypothetical protein
MLVALCMGEKREDDFNPIGGEPCWLDMCSLHAIPFDDLLVMHSITPTPGIGWVQQLQTLSLTPSDYECIQTTYHLDKKDACMCTDPCVVSSILDDKKWVCVDELMPLNKVVSHMLAQDIAQKNNMHVNEDDQQLIECVASIKKVFLKYPTFFFYWICVV